MEDENSGTHPDQSERMYAALKGNGCATRLVMLPKEGHGYRARESILHTLAETYDYLQAHCIQSPLPVPPPAVKESKGDPALYAVMVFATFFVCYVARAS